MRSRFVLLIAGLASATAALAEPTKSAVPPKTCACPGSRLLRAGKVVPLGPNNGIAAWLNGSKDARLTPMERTAAGDWTPLELPWEQTLYETPRAALPNRKQLVFARSPAPGTTPFFVTLWEKGHQRPSDVVRVEPTPPDEPDNEDKVPKTSALLAAIHLGPPASRESAGCGAYQTLPVVYAERVNEAEPAAFWVEHRPRSGELHTALIDARHVKIFGLGRVPACEEGLAFDPALAGSLSMRALSHQLELGPTWEWELGPSDGEHVPTPLTIPAHADLSAVENPYVAGYRTPLERLLSDDTDHAALGLMLFCMAGAAVAAFLVWRVWRHAQPNWVNVTCPACAAELRLDAAKKGVDGTFCPHCGGSSVFISFSADGRAKAAAFRVEAKQ